jgi:hypothetical protein
MSVSLAQRFVATTQGQSQFLLQLMKVAKFPLHVGQLLFQSALHGPTGLQAIPPQPQESSDLAELEPQALHAANKGQRLHIVFTVPAKTSLRPGRPRKQAVTFIKTNRINAQPDLFRDDANLHYPGSLVEATPWSTVQSQVVLSAATQQVLLMVLYL